MLEPRIIKKIEKANLIGRGCNNFPTATKWRLVRAAKAKKEKYVICNISESEPGVFKDYYILENWLERVVEGIKLAMKTIGAKKGFIYLNPEYYQEFQESLREIISKGILRIELFQKSFHDYIGGEETALINLMEGKRVEPKLKPPFPTTCGFLGEPTLVNNCETFYAVSLINTGEYKHTRFYCLSGDDVACADGLCRGRFGSVRTDDGIGLVKELPVGITIKKCLQEFGLKPNKNYFYLVGGGASGTCYNYKQLEHGFSGLASIVVYRVESDEQELIMNWAEFFKYESCGQCVPCREGTYRLHSLLEKYYLGKKKFNQKLFDDLVFTLQNTSFCPLGEVSANAILSYFRHIKGKKVYAGLGEKCDMKV